MVFNKITLTFPAKDERRFRETYFFDSLIQVRVSFIFVSILYGIFGFLDSQLIPNYIKLFHIIRYAIVVPVFIFVFILSFTRLFQKIWQVLLFASFIIGGTGIAIMTMLVPQVFTYYGGMMLVFSAGYFFIKLRFFLAAIAGWTLILIFNIGAVFYAETPYLLLISINFFFISTNLIGMFAAYNIEYYSRRNFFLNQNLDNEKIRVEETNKNLEKVVEERTRELFNAKELAVESDRLKSAFLANMSHEIRTPMNGILGFSELLKNPELSGDQQQMFIGIIEKSGKRMLNIINDIIDISKIESGLMKTNIAESNINEQIEYIYTFFKPEVEAKGLTLTFRNSLPHNESLISTDREKVYAILTNLVKNAIKYTEQGTIEFGYTVGTTSMQFYVKDTGIGIPIDRQSAIFERFIQADIADKMARSGAGLGLSISKAYIEMLGGEIWVESEEGAGSVFYFTLPYKTEQKNPVNQNGLPLNAGKTILPSEVSGLKVLIAEDDEVSEILLGIEVTAFAKQILKVRTGVDAVNSCRENPDIDLVLMDIRVPELGGLDATRQIRQFNKDVVIIAQTAYGLAGDRERAIGAGCTDYITKPINKTELVLLIEKYFN